MFNLKDSAAVCGLVLAATLAGAISKIHAQTPSPASAPLRPIIDYVNHADFRSARLSPDGAHIALVAPQENRENLVILDARTIQIKASFQTLVNNKISRFEWANEERIVFQTAINADGGDQVFLTGDIFAFNVDNTRKFILGGPSIGDGAAFFLLDALEDDRDHILVMRKDIKNSKIARSRPETMKINIYRDPNAGNGRIISAKGTEPLDSPFPWGDLYTDNAGKVRLAVASSEEGKLQIKLRQDEQWQDLTSFLETSTDLASAMGRPLGFTSKNDGIYYLSHTSRGTIGISLFDIQSRQSRLIYANDKYDVGPGDLLTSADGKELIGVEIMGQQPERHYFSPEHPDVAFRKSLDKSLGTNSIRFINFTKGQRKGLAMVSGSTIAPALFLLDRDAGTFSPLFSSRPRLQGSAMTKAELLTIQSRDGIKIDAYLTKAAGVQGPAPLIVLIHGGPHGGRDMPTFDPEVKLLASRGYSVLQVNYRGSGGYGERFQRGGYRHWGTAMIDDIIDATRYVAKQGMARSDQICAMGTSFGGYGAMMAVARYPDLFKCGVGISGIYDLNLMRKSDIPYLPGGDDYLEMVIGSDERELDANSPVNLVSNIKVPIFLAHGGDDRRTPIKNAEVFKKALDKAHVKYEWFYVASAGHGFALPVNREKLYTELFNFIETSLNGPDSSLQLRAISH